MAFKRAQWHSGLTYRQTCEECKTTIEYTDELLDFRPWYADGFVYCPKCNTPLRHNEMYAINNPNMKVVNTVVDEVETVISDDATTGEAAKFCSNCGNTFKENDRFCSQCGTKR